MADVLVVDDDPAIRILLTAILEHEGFAVVQSADGFEALERIAARRFDAVILDLMMPHLSGIDFLERLAGLTPPCRNVIVLTAAHPRQFAAMNRRCVRAVMRKPFDIHELVAQVRSVCGREILLVEDNPADLYLIERQLLSEGYAVTTAPDGREALRMLREKEFRALVVDLNLPVVSGYDVLDAARSKDSFPPTVVLTGLDVLARPIVADAVLHKPAGFDELLPTLRSLVC